MTEFWFGDAESYHSYHELEEKVMSGVLAVSFSEEIVEDKGAYLLEKVGDTAIVNIKGSLVSNFSPWHQAFPGSATSYESIVSAVATATNDQSVKRIVLNFATGGGSVRGVDQAGEAIRKAGMVKPVIAHTDSHMFSAGYWLASSANSVSASRMAEVGSIGTLAVLENYKEAAEKQGVKFHVFRSGEHKALGMPMEELTPEAKAYIQENVERSNKFFINHVSSRRNLMVSDAKNWADGKTFYAEDALSIGLIDKVGTLSDLIPVQLPQPDNRSYDAMSPEKQAQISGGAAPEVVLTAEELVEYEASLDNEPVHVEQKAEELTFAKQVGRLEVQLEASELARVAAEAKLLDMSATMDALMVVAQTAVGNLQNALRKPKEVKATASEVIAQHTALQAEMADVFKRGQQTVTPVNDTTAKPEAAKNFRSF